MFDKTSNMAIWSPCKHLISHDVLKVVPYSGADKSLIIEIGLALFSSKLREK